LEITGEREKSEISSAQPPDHLFFGTDGNDARRPILANYPFTIIEEYDVSTNPSELSVIDGNYVLANPSELSFFFIDGKVMSSNSSESPIYYQRGKWCVDQT
jgi:hypothetical protein